MTITAENIKRLQFPRIRRIGLSTLQVNLGYKCNQACVHCHVNAGPNRKEMMTEENIALVPEVLKKYKIKTLDLTGGAPELHPKFKELVLEAKAVGTEVIDRCNLTILSEVNQEDLASFLAENKVIVTASLPCYEEKNVDKQRGGGVFARSIFGLKKLNEQGYGLKDTDLELNLVYNPQGPNLPPNQNILEEQYKKELYSRFSIEFNKLYTIANMPIQRFAQQLNITGEYLDYMRLLKTSYNKDNLKTLMCKELISVNWEGKLYDCDFNQQLGISLGVESLTLRDLLDKKRSIEGEAINIGEHCFGCTAGNGSSCGGALTN